jgi:hypothetical protein
MRNIIDGAKQELRKSLSQNIHRLQAFWEMIDPERNVNLQEVTVKIDDIPDRSILIAHKKKL